MWEILVVILAGGAILLGGRHENQQRRRAWQDAVVPCGLQGVEFFGWWSLELVAQAGPLQVRIAETGQKQPKARITVGVPGPPGFYGVRIRPEGLPLPWVREIEIGDGPFDSTFHIQGPRDLVFALLDAETRRLLSLVNAKSRLELNWGSLIADTSDEEIANILPLLLEIGQRFVRSIDAPQRCLAENANRDPESRVRLQNLLLLIREPPWGCRDRRGVAHRLLGFEP